MRYSSNNFQPKVNSLSGKKGIEIIHLFINKTYKVTQLKQRDPKWHTA